MSFQPEEPMNAKVKTIQREDLINYAKLRMYITEEESLEFAGKLSLEKQVEILSKTTYDMLMSFEAAARRAKKDQPPHPSPDLELTIWLKDFPSTASDFRAFLHYQPLTLKQPIHAFLLLEEHFLLELEDEELLKFSSSDPTMERYY